MTNSLSGVWRKVGLAIPLVAYPFLAHFTSTSGFVAARPGVSAAVSLAPALGFLLWLVFRSCRLPFALLQGFVLAAGLWMSWSFLERNFNWIYFVQNAATNTMLGYFFGHTLAKGGKPLVTWMAEGIQGSLSPALIRYTRQVTVAWTLFFAGNIVVSTLLFLLAPLETWSVYSNLLYLPLVALMFVAEYMVRLWRLPDEKHSPLDSLRAYRKLSGAAPEASANGR